MFDVLPFISRRLPIVWQVDVTIVNGHNSEKYTKIKTSHFMNSVFVQPGVYSFATDCFLEVSTYLFLPVLLKLSAQSQFPELLFAAASDYQNQGANPSLLAGIQEPVWSYQRERCSSFQARDRLRVVPHFSSGIEEQAKRERA